MRTFTRGWERGRALPPRGTISQRLKIARFGDNMREVARH